MRACPTLYTYTEGCLGNHSDGWPQPWSGAKGGGKIFVFPLLLFRGKRGEDKTADGKMGGEEGMDGGLSCTVLHCRGGKVIRMLFFL